MELPDEFCLDFSTLRRLPSSRPRAWSPTWSLGLASHTAAAAAEWSEPEQAQRGVSLTIGDAPQVRWHASLEIDDTMGAQLPPFNRGKTLEIHDSLPVADRSSQRLIMIPSELV